jgi:hypothetical protein
MVTDDPFALAAEAKSTATTADATSTMAPLTERFKKTPTFRLMTAVAGR